MQLEYEITVQDYIDYNSNYRNKSNTNKHSILISRLIAPGVFLIMPFLLNYLFDGTSLGYWYFIFIIIAIVWFIYYPIDMKKSFERRISKILAGGNFQGILGNHIFTITENELVDKTEISEIKYNHIHTIVETDNHIFIFLNTVTAYIIPKRFFINEDEKNNFLLLLSKFKES